MPSSAWDFLPTEVGLAVFGRLYPPADECVDRREDGTLARTSLSARKLRDVRAARLACRTWREQVSEAANWLFPRTANLEIPAGIRQFSGAKWAIVQWRNDPGCRLAESFPGQHLLDRIRCFPGSLERLSLLGCSIAGALSLSTLQGLPRLRHLDLQGCSSVTDAALAALQPLTGLASLDLSACMRVSDNGLRHLTSLKSLTWLNLQQCGAVSDTGIAELAALTGLVHLELRECFRVGALLSHSRTPHSKANDPSVTVHDYNCV